jgi:hypothetical protein
MKRKNITPRAPSVPERAVRLRFEIPRRFAGLLRGEAAGSRMNSGFFEVFFLRCANFARIVLAVRGSYASTRAGT